MTLKRGEVLAEIAALKGEAVSVATMQSIPGWHALGGAEQRHLDAVGCMGSAAALGLGVALAAPGRKVLVLDGDGSLVMQLGGLATIAGASPANFYHFVFVNGVYQTSGNQPIPGSGVLDFAAMARAAGYVRADSFSDSGVLRERLPALLQQPGPALFALEIEVAEEGGQPFPRLNARGQIEKLRDELEAG